MRKQTKILIVDDENDHIVLISRSLEKHQNYEIQAVYSIEEALSALATFHPDILLADFRLPDGDARLLIKHSLNKIPIIVMTSYGNEALAVEMIKGGALDYLVKTQENFSNISWFVERSLREWENIQERRKAENALQQSNEQLSNLNHKLVKTIDELKISQEKAIESDRLKSAFLANMSHEIRTPMNGILGFANLLVNKNIEEEERVSYVEIINNCGNQLLVILNDLIDIAKIEANQISLDMQEININDLMNELARMFEPKINSNLQFTHQVGLHSDACIVLTDSVRLKQILSNLISNSIKFTSEGSISFGYSLKKDQLEFYVKDTGIGISAEQQEIIFQRFIQADVSTTRMFGGTGLGLSISKALVEMLGGKIWVDSTIDLGSTFFFTIPYNPIKQQNVSTPFTENDIGIYFHNKTVLIVEDDNVNYHLLEVILSKVHCHLHKATNGIEAIECLRTDPAIDLVLMDLKMPLMDGYEATRELKLIRPDIPIIVQTALSMPEDKAKALQTGCDYFITKPIIIEELLKIMRTIFSDSH